MSSLSSSATSWRLSLEAGRDRVNRTGSSDSRHLDPSRDREKTKTMATGAGNETNTKGSFRRQSFSSMLSSGNRITGTRLSRGKPGSTGHGTAPASFRSSSAARFNRKGSERVLPPAAAPTTVPIDPQLDPLDVGSDLLEFGASVEFSDDHRRTIHAETQVIEASNEATKRNVNKEISTEERLQKDLGRARSELFSLSQGASDQLETAKMFSALAENLDREFRSGILEPTTPSAMRAGHPAANIALGQPPSVSQQVAPMGRNGEAHPENDPQGGDGDGDDSSTRPRSNKEVLAEKEARANAILQELKEETKSIEAVRAEIRGLDERRVQLEESMKFQGLEESLKRAQDEDRRLQSEIKQNRDARATRIVEIRQSRESCGSKAQKYTDLTKELNEAKKSNAAKEVNLQKELQTIKIEAERLQKEKEEKMLRIELEKRKVEEAKKQIKDYEYYCKAKDDYHKQVEIRSEKKKELLALQIEAKRRLQEAQEAEKASLLRKQEGEESMRLAEAKKKGNDEMEINTILPGKEELAKLTERKMELASEIGEFSKEIERDQAKEREALTARAKARDDATEHAEQLATEYRVKQEENQAASKKHQEFRKSHEEQIASHRSLEEKFSGMYEAQKEAYNSKLEEAHERWSEKLSKHAQEQERMYEAQAFRVEVFEKGIVLIEAAQAAEREASDTPGDRSRSPSMVARRTEPRRSKRGNR